MECYIFLIFLLLISSFIILPKTDVFGYIIDITGDWNYKLDDGILTYHIDSNDKIFNAIIDLAMNNWEDKLSIIKFDKLDNFDIRSDLADITFVMLDDTEKLFDKTESYSEYSEHAMAKTYTYYSNNELKLIKNVIISLSSSSIISIPEKNPYLSKSDIMIYLYNIIRHEIGHMLGLGHASSQESIMFPRIEYNSEKLGLVKEITDCEVYYVYRTNHLLEYAENMEDDYAPSNIRVCETFSSY